MKNILKLSILFLPAFLATSCMTGNKLAEQKNLILPLSDTVTIREGSIIYGLPRTVLNIVFEMERTVEIPGPYAQYAYDLLGLSNVIQTQREFWTIKDLSVKTSDELDPSEFYVIQSNTLFQTNILSLKKEGLIMDLNPEIYNTPYWQSVKKESSANQVHPFDLGSDEYFQLQRDTAYKRVKIDSSFIRIPYIVEKKNKLSVEQLAEKAARRLMEMRDGKHMILTGEATVFPQNDAAINEINRIEKEYTELFTGKTLKETMIFTSQIIPDKESGSKPVTLFQFSEMKGMIPVKTKGGIPVTFELIPEQRTKDLTIIRKIQPETAGQQYDKLFYRVPNVVKLKISMGTEILFNSRKLIYQFGDIIQLPANYIIGK